MKKFITLLVLCFSIAGCVNRSLDDLTVKVYPANPKNTQVGGDVFTQIDIETKDGCYSKTYFVDKNTGKIVFEGIDLYDCNKGPVGSAQSFVVYRDDKPCKVLTIELSTNSLSKEEWDFYTGVFSECDSKEKIQDDILFIKKMDERKK